MSDAALRAKLTDLLSTTLHATPAQPVGGGCINECFRYETGKGPIFVKVSKREQLDVFEAEAVGLDELRAVEALRIPIVLAVGATEHSSFLALEWIDLRSPTKLTHQRLGAQLAALHRNKKPLYGFKRGNFIGRTPQANLWSRDWLHFWRTHRFDVQLDLAASHGADSRFMERAALLSALMDGFFTSYVPDACLLHGDLWNGNYGADSHESPVLFDPAVYYGDRECDIAMTRLFGGFGAEFYESYQRAWPLDAGWEARVELYNLYHVLNHFNLFRGGYLSQADAMINKLLSELGH